MVVPHLERLSVKDGSQVPFLNRMQLVGAQIHLGYSHASSIVSCINEIEVPCIGCAVIVLDKDSRKEAQRV